MASYVDYFLYLLVDKFPPSLTVPMSCRSSLRYGENPHQEAAFYVDRSLAEINGGGIATAIQHHGKVSNNAICYKIIGLLNNNLLIVCGRHFLLFIGFK